MSNPKIHTSVKHLCLVISLLIFFVLYTGSCAFILLSAKALPERVASHFDFNGQADGWMSRSGYILFAIFFPLGISLFLGLIGWLIRYLPASMINMPNKNYWLAPERKAKTACTMFIFMIWLACILLLFFTAIHISVIQANKMVPPKLSQTHTAGNLVGFLIVLAVWIIAMFKQFAMPKNQPTK